MNRSFYSSAIFIAGLTILSGLLWSVIYFWLGTRVGELQSIGGWFLSGAMISIVWSLILLKYYHYKRYWFTFWAMLILIGASLLQYILLFNVVSSREMTEGYIIVSLVLLGMGVPYGISLVFSEAGNRPWLKAAGLFSFFTSVIMFLATFWLFNSLTALHNGIGATIEQLGILIVSIGPVLFMMNFRSERSAIEKTDTSRQKPANTIMGIVAIVAVVSTLYFGSSLVIESITLSGNPDKVSDYLKKIAEPFEARTYANSRGDLMRYRLLKPLDYDSTKQYPLVVCLHGSSGRGTDNTKQVAASISAQLLSRHENRTKYPAFLLVPQCPHNADWGGITNIQAVDSLVFETISTLEEEFSIDEGRRYVAGISMGGFGTWHLISSRPEVFAAAMPIAGGGNPVLAQNIVDLPIWAFHGAKDRNVLVRGSRDIIQAIKDGGGDPRYIEYPDKAHHIAKNVEDTPGLLDWLFAQQRN